MKKTPFNRMILGLSAAAMAGTISHKTEAEMSPPKPKVENEVTVDEVTHVTDAPQSTPDASNS